MIENPENMLDNIDSNHVWNVFKLSTLKFNKTIKKYMILNKPKVLVNLPKNMELVYMLNQNIVKIKSKIGLNELIVAEKIHNVNVIMIKKINLTNNSQGNF